VATATGLDFLVGAATTRMAGAATELAPALAMTNPPTLSPNPKSLYDLWDDYLNGLGGENLQGCSLNPSKGVSNTSILDGRLCGMSQKSLLISGTLPILQ
jgi:hypothetical protein